MTVSTLDSLGTVNALERFHAEQDEQARAEQALKDEFLAAARKGDLMARADFAPMVPATWDTKRRPLVAELLVESLDFTNGPETTDVLAILCAVAYSDKPQVAAARELIDRMAGKWASMNVGAV